MATIKYLIKGKGNPSTIYLRFRHGRAYDFTKKTSLLVPSNYWSSNKGAVKQISTFTDKKNLQNELNNLQNHILNSFNEVYSSGGVVSSEWLENSIKSFFSQNTNSDYRFFTDYAKYFHANLESKILKSGKTGASTSTIKKYQTIINKLEQFEKYKKTRLKLEDINLKFHKDFIYFLSKVQKLNFNTTGKYLTFIKTICLDAKKYGLKVSDEVLDDRFRATREKVYFTTLNTSEIEKIYNHSFIDRPFLENAKKWLIIGVWTGARVSDLLNFTKKNIKNGFIEYTAVKTQQKIVLPLHPQVNEIIESGNGEFPRKISSQKFNDYIKLICKDVGLKDLIQGAKSIKIKDKTWRKVIGKYEKWELVSTHICRRSFATNHYGKLPTPVIMAVTGHTTEKMFLNYIGKTAKDNAEVLNNFWQNQKIMKDQKPQLSVVKTGTN